MDISNNGLKLIKKWEGCYLQAYQDIVGVWTVGFGVTNADKAITGTTIRKGLKISQATADKWLVESIHRIYQKKVDKYMPIYRWNQNQYDALVSFCYNIGNIDGLTANGTRSNSVIAKKMLEYSKAGGRFVQGLYNRRKDEQKLFLTPVKAEEKPVKVEKKPVRKEESEYNMPVIKKGSKGKAVKVWQVIIGAAIDGEFGKKTEDKTKEFQKEHGLKADGVVGKYTWSKGLGSIA